MALTLESANRVRQKTFAFSRNPGIFYLLKALFLHFAANKSNSIQLQLVNVDGTSMSSDGGAAQQVVANVACTLYAIYLITRTTGPTTTWFKLTDNASTCTTNGGEDIHYAFKAKSEERLYVAPIGHAMSNGITIDENTTATGGTETLKANRLDGFIILGS